MTEEERYAIAWRDLRRRYVIALIVTLLFFIPFFVQPTIYIGQPWYFWLVMIPLVIAWGWKLAFRCPRCGRVFADLRPAWTQPPQTLHTVVESWKSGVPPRPRCRHCGLGQWAPFQEHHT